MKKKESFFVEFRNLRNQVIYEKRKSKNDIIKPF